MWMLVVLALVVGACSISPGEGQSYRLGSSETSFIAENTACGTFRYGSDKEQVFPMAKCTVNPDGSVELQIGSEAAVNAQAGALVGMARALSALAAPTVP